jgi:hypothetical protein
MAGERAKRHRLNHDTVAAAEKNFESPRQCGLRLEGDDARLQASKRRNAITHMGPDIENEASRSDKTRIQAIHRAMAPSVPVVNAKRARDTKGGSQSIERRTNSSHRSRSCCRERRERQRLQRGRRDSFLW